MSKFILSAFSDEYCQDFEGQLKAMNALGFTHIEPRGLDGINVAELTREQALHYKALLDEYGIKVYTIGSPLGKIRIDGDFEYHMAKAERVFEIAKLFGATRVRMFSFYPPEGESMGPQYKDKVIEYLTRMLAAAKAHGLVLCHENEGKIYGESPESCLELLEHFGGEMRCVFDMGNFVLGGYDPEHAYDLLAPYVDYFHIKEALKSGAVVPPGKGDAHIADIIARHRDKVGKDVVISLEPHLSVFMGRKDITTTAFTNPYEYESKEAAFTDAANKLKEIVSAI